MEIIVISNRKGGVGKTTFASNLANELRLLGHVTVMVDMDAQQDLSKGYYTKAKGKLTIVDVLKGNCTVDDACLEVRVQVASDFHIFNSLVENWCANRAPISTLKSLGNTTTTIPFSN